MGNSRSQHGQPKRKAGVDWKSVLRQPLVLILVVSLAIHVLLLLVFGGVALFRGGLPRLPFLSQSVFSDSVPEVAPPPMEEAHPTDEMPKEDPFATASVSQDSGEEGGPELELLTVVEGARWAPMIPKSSPVSENGMMGGTGKGTGSGTGTGKGPTGPLVERQLFGVPLKARKLGVVVDISMSMQRHAPAIFEEIFSSFPDADVIFTNGGGMQDWPVALGNFNEEVKNRERREKETGKRIPGAKTLDKPRLVRFSGGEAEDWVPVRGSQINRENYRGLKEDYPELYEKMRRRGNTWFVTSYASANAVYLAFEALIQRKAEAIYWFSDFADPIEGKEAEKVTQQIRDGRVQVILHSTRGKGKAAEWASQVEATFVKTKL